MFLYPLRSDSSAAVTSSDISFFFSRIATLKNKLPFYHNCNALLEGCKLPNGSEPSSFLFGLHLLHQPLVHPASQSCTLRNGPDAAGEGAVEKSRALWCITYTSPERGVGFQFVYDLRERERHACHWQREKEWPGFPLPLLVAPRPNLAFLNSTGATIIRILD